MYLGMPVAGMSRKEYMLLEGDRARTRICTENQLFVLSKNGRYIKEGEYDPKGETFLQ